MGRVRLADVHLPIPQKPPPPSYSTRQSTNIDVTTIHSPNDSAEFSLDTITCRMTGVRVFFLVCHRPSVDRRVLSVSTWAGLCTYARQKEAEQVTFHFHFKNNRDKRLEPESILGHGHTKHGESGREGGRSQACARLQREISTETRVRWVDESQSTDSRADIRDENGTPHDIQSDSG